MTIRKRYHVVVIGGGITGLSTALHLRRLGVSHIAISQGETRGSPSRLASGLCAGGQLDNFTRLSHLHGMNLAAEIWALGNRAFDSMESYAKDRRIALQIGRRIRLLSSPAELAEANKAELELSLCGLPGKTQTSRPSGLHERILGIQDDGTKSAFVDSEELFRSLSTATSNIPRIPPTKGIIRGGESIALLLADGMTIHTEVTVVAAHLATGTLIPELASALVPFTDQWTEFQLEHQLLPEWCSPGTVFTTNHTHEWGVAMNDKTVRLGGGRYLRPMAGLESTIPTVDPKIIDHMKDQLSRTLTPIAKDQLTPVCSFGMVDIKPCDELPVIGPMFGESRILVGTGYGGQGLQMGFYAGALLAELIDRGSAPGLPRSLWPERLRSLPENT